VFGVWVLWVGLGLGFGVGVGVGVGASQGRIYCLSSIPSKGTEDRSAATRTCTTCCRICTSAGVFFSIPSPCSRYLAVEPFISTEANAMTAMKNTQWA